MSLTPSTDGRSVHGIVIVVDIHKELADSASSRTFRSIECERQIPEWRDVRIKEGLIKPS